MPNGYCICYPERNIVCGQHDPRTQRGWAKVWRLPFWWPATFVVHWNPRDTWRNGVWLMVWDEDRIAGLSFRIRPLFVGAHVSKWWDTDQ